MKKLAFLSIAALTILGFSCSRQVPQARNTESFNAQWRFALGDDSTASQPEFNDASWRELQLPHDWSVEGKFDEKAPAGTGGGALPGGTGWYRKTFNLPLQDSGQRIFITFDGVYQNSSVFINGHLLGKRPNGYISFQYDLTPYLHYGTASNVIAVRVDNSDQPNSRWYSGSGIYRNVWLVKTHPVHVALWGIHVTTPNVTEQLAEVNLEITIDNTLESTQDLTLETKIFNAENKIVAKTSSQLNVKPGTNAPALQQLSIENPVLWNIENPYLYKAINYLILGNKVIDVYETSFGLRYFEYSADKGFLLNGNPVKIKGVCNHHDLGALGSAFNTRAAERQLEILKEMGCNGIRTSHNPPAPELLDLCDRMGFIVMDETFDMWRKKKVENDYSKYFDEWHVRDLTDHLLRDRNHPSIFSWSIGNEILEQWDTTGITIAAELAAIVRQYAPYIPITSAMNGPVPSNYIIKSGALDLIGFNYHHEAFESFRDSFPNQKFIATETTSSLNSRGVYNMPSDSVNIWPVRWDLPFYDGNPDNTCSSYDNCRAPWGSTHRDTWRLIKRNNYLSGMYIWTGFDYIGEPTPYGWPSRSSYFGIVDLAGFPKDIYYFYQAEWSNKDVLHIFPHWNWKPGQKIDMVAYTNCTEVELFVNGVSKGKQFYSDTTLNLTWNLTFEPGEVKAVGKTKLGREMVQTIQTAGPAYKIALSADRSSIKADGSDLSFISVSVLDEKGNLVPDADHLISFEVEGDGKIVAVDNGLQTSMESFKASECKAYNGKCLAILAGYSGKGCKVKATSPGLMESEIEIIFN